MKLILLALMMLGSWLQAQTTYVWDGTTWTPALPAPVAGVRNFTANSRLQVAYSLVGPSIGDISVPGNFNVELSPGTGTLPPSLTIGNIAITAAGALRFTGWGTVLTGNITFSATAVEPAQNRLAVIQDAPNPTVLLPQALTVTPQSAGGAGKVNFPFTGSNLIELQEEVDNGAVLSVCGGLGCLLTPDRDVTGSVVVGGNGNANFTCATGSNCACIQVCTVGGSWGSTNPPGPGPGQPTSLPVTLVSLTARRVGLDVELTWITASEENSAYFEILRSTDGRTWTTGARIAAAGTSNTFRTYSTTDRGANTFRFYRLRQVDLDGTVNLLPIVELDAANRARFALSPNPANNGQQLQLTALDAGINPQAVHAIQLLDAKGNVLLVGQGGLGQLAGQLNARMSNVGTGMYLVRISNDQTSQVLRLLWN